MRRFFILIVVFNAGACFAGNMRDGERNGEVLENKLAWSETKKEWLSIEDFWLEHARSDDRKYWGITRVYPPYKLVGETDTLMIRTEHGNCLMEFWHSRWRRANDVRRWDQKFNDYGGCPYVFD